MPKPLRQEKCRHRVRGGKLNCWAEQIVSIQNILRERVGSYQRLAEWCASRFCLAVRGFIKIAHRSRCPCPVTPRSRRKRSRNQRKLKRWCRNWCRISPIAIVRRSEIHICRQATTKRLQSVCFESVSSSTKRTMMLPRLRHLTIVGRPRMPWPTKIYDAIFMRSAIPWCTLAAIHRSRRSLGLFLIHRSNDRSTPCTYR